MITGADGLYNESDAIIEVCDGIRQVMRELGRRICVEDFTPILTTKSPKDQGINDWQKKYQAAELREIYIKRLFRQPLLRSYANRSRTRSKARKKCRNSASSKWLRSPYSSIASQARQSYPCGYFDPFTASDRRESSETPIEFLFTSLQRHHAQN